ncbi:hypothetical protein L249_8382 [Ophiocordyceps polyrhachis-furcata BCC 54312]|uniref:Uncharacterized protein n=1 Tax=Ophiocordyceps polyrhachis-furcata BCC 54312 TaxID=1330021 RepID=A0A367L6T8_9HYPO|nr:hypothetical protein L249_8382 [Ophiocordyceps polyrhachis-furcata BCC 54312]
MDGGRGGMMRKHDLGGGLRSESLPEVEERKSVLKEEIYSAGRSRVASYSVVMQVSQPFCVSCLCCTRYCIRKVFD